MRENCRRRRVVVDLKAEYPGFNPNEIANAVYVRFGRRPARKTVKRVLAEEPAPRQPRGPLALQEVLFPYAEAL